jgi:hypothetical protein
METANNNNKIWIDSALAASGLIIAIYVMLNGTIDKYIEKKFERDKVKIEYEKIKSQKANYNKKYLDIFNQNSQLDNDINNYQKEYEDLVVEMQKKIERGEDIQKDFDDARAVKKLLNDAISQKNMTNDSLQEKVNISELYPSTNATNVNNIDSLQKILSAKKTENLKLQRLCQ